MINILQPDIAQIVDVGSSRPTTIIEVIEKAVRAEYHLARIHQEHSEVKKGDTSDSKPFICGIGRSGKNNKRKKGGRFGKQDLIKRQFPLCLKCNKLYPKECKKGTT